MAQELSPELLNAVMQAESRGKRYDEKNRLLTSKKGAKGEMQVLDKTNLSPGFGVTPAKDKSPDERARVGRDYLAAMINRYPDRDTALMAYNWGPGNVDNWLKAGAPASKIPEETRNYVSKIDKMLTKDTQQAKAPAPATPDRATLEMNKAIDSGISAQAPAAANVVSRTAAYGPSYQAALAVSMLGDTDEKEDKDPEEPTEAEKFLAAGSEPTAAKALAKLDLGYESPFQDPAPVKMAEGGEVTQEEIEAASRPAFITPSSGIGRKEGPISGALRSGEAYTAAARGISEMPYNLLGAPMDLAMLARQALTGQAPAGQVGTSEFIKRKATELGIRPAPPTDPTLRGFYDVGDIGSSVVNPASVPRAAARGAAATGKALSAAAQDFQQYNQQLAVPGASYAVRQRGVPVAIAPRSPNTSDDFLMSMSADERAAFEAKNPDVEIYDSRAVQGTKEFDKFSPPIDEAESLAKTLATTPDQPLNSWFSKALPRYLRTDFATTKDQLVMAADDNKLLHFVPKKFSDSAEDQNLQAFLGRKQRQVKQTRGAEAREAEKRGAEALGSVAKTEYGKRVEDLTDLSAYMDPVDVLSTNRIPPSMRSLVQTDPEARVTDFAPGIVDNLQLNQLRDKMLEIRAAGPAFSAYNQPKVKVPDELLLPDDTLAKLNVAGASNRVARYTRWQDETRQGMATTALRNDPTFRRQSLQEGKFLGVALPDIRRNPEFKKLVTDVGCDGGWCTRYGPNAESYASGDSQLHVIVTGQGKQARPIAQVAVESIIKDGRITGRSITEIKTAGNTTDFKDYPGLPAIQEYVQKLDNAYGGLKFVDQLSNLGMTQLPKNPMDLLTMGVGYGVRLPLEKAFGSERAGLDAVRSEAIRLNNGSQYTTGNEDDVADLLRRALGNVLTPQQRATGGMIERQSTATRKYL